jgi:very-short-patch-repair endonuclease
LNDENSNKRELTKYIDDENEKTRKYRKDMDNNEEINVLNKIFNSKLTDIKEQKQKKIEDKPGPEIKKKLIKSLISNINI